MADKGSDPVDAWRKMLGDWEKGVNAFANQAMEQKDFARVMGVATGAATGAQSTLADLMQRYLATMNLPSRSELSNIGERLQAIEAQLRQLNHLVQGMAGNGGPAQETGNPIAPKPARTRQPASSTHGKGELL